MRIQAWIVCIFIYISMSCWPGIAAGQENSANEKGKPLLELGIGISALSIPDYRGSEDDNIYILPFPFIIYRGEFLKADGRTVRGIFFKGDKFEVDVSLDASPPVKSNDSDAREGMHDLDPTIEFGPNATYQFYSKKDESGKFAIEVKLSLRRIVATDVRHYDAKGWIFHPRLNMDYQVLKEPLKGWNFGFSAGPLFGTAKFHRYYYDVDPEFETAARPRFKSDGGYSGTRLTATLSKRFGQYWIGAFLRTDFLDGAKFQDSPLVKRNVSIMGGIGIAWIFYQSSRR